MRLLLVRAPGSLSAHALAGALAAGACLHVRVAGSLALHVLLGASTSLSAGSSYFASS